MKYIIIKPKDHIEKALFDKIDRSAELIYKSFRNQDLAEIGISEYNQRYITHYIDNYTFYLQLYTQILIVAIRELTIPIEEAVFIDYGGGSGIFSFLAKSTGFKTVVYNDIYDVSVADVKILSKNNGIKIDHFVCGDIDDLVKELNEQKIQANLVCSFDVLEHIYNIEDWFKHSIKLGHQFTLVFSSSANIRNYVISRRLKAVQQKAENLGKEKKWGDKNRDTSSPFVEIRKEIIKNYSPSLSEDLIQDLAKRTRGYAISDIQKAIDAYSKQGKPIKEINHPTNTCDPYTGNWSEHLINHYYLKKTVTEAGYTSAQIQPAFYTLSTQKLVNLAKKILNLFISIPGIGIYFSPLYVLVAKKK